MHEIPVRKLRNDVSSVLRRAEAGERMRVTVNGRPVAEIGPLHTRPESITWDAFTRLMHGSYADAGLRQDLANLLPDTTDNVDGGLR